MSDTTDSTNRDSAWSFTVDQVPTTDDMADIEQMLARNLGLDPADIITVEEDEGREGEVEAIVANPPTAGDVMAPGSASDQDVNDPLATPDPTPDLTPSDGGAATEPGEGHATTASPGDVEDAEPAGDLIWSDDDASTPQVDESVTESEQSSAPTGVIDTYFAVAYGEQDPHKTIEAIEANLAVVRQIESLPQQQQQIIGAILRGEPLPGLTAPAPTPAAQPAPAPAAPVLDDWGLPVDPPAPAPTPTPATDPRVDMLLAQQQQMIAAQRAQQQQQIMRGTQDAVAAFRANHPELSTDEVAALAQRVTTINAWAYEVNQGVQPSEAFLRHLEGNLAIDPTLAPKVQSARAATQHIRPTAPAPEAPQRQARSAAISGASSPSSGRRRSVIDPSTPHTPTSTPKNRVELAREIQQAIEQSGAVVP